jgi:hypothetical protein
MSKWISSIKIGIGNHGNPEVLRGGLTNAPHRTCRVKTEHTVLGFE